MMMNRKLLVPLLVFALLMMLLAFGFGLRDPHYLPSELIDRPFPAFTLADLHWPERELTEDAVRGNISLVNIWATWCPNCLVEHPELMRISSEEDIPLIGVNYNDESAAARAWLKRYGNPYAFSIVDDEGRLAIDLGVYGAPETFIVDSNGVIRYRHVGPVTREVWGEILSPVIKQIGTPG